MNLADYPGSVTVIQHSAVPASLEIVNADPKIRVSLEAAILRGPEMRIHQEEHGTGFIDIIGANGTVTYRIDGFDLPTLTLCCSLLHDGRTITE